MNFNPRSLTGATGGVGDAKDVGLISIHAPLRERLAQKFDTLPVLNISIHAPLRERLLFPLPRQIMTLFQSTLPYGSDQMQWQELAGKLISIHAPLRERRATSH